MQTILTSLVSCRSVDEAAVGAWIQILPGKRRQKLMTCESTRYSFRHNVHICSLTVSAPIFVPSQGLASPQLLPNKLQISALQPDLPGQNFSNFTCCVM